MKIAFGILAGWMFVAMVVCLFIKVPTQNDMGCIYWVLTLCALSTSSSLWVIASILCAIYERLKNVTKARN